MPPTPACGLCGWSDPFGCIGDGASAVGGFIRDHGASIAPPAAVVLGVACTIASEGACTAIAIQAVGAPLGPEALAGAAGVGTVGTVASALGVAPGDEADSMINCLASETEGEDAADHIVLGKSLGLGEQAAKIGGRHLMGSAHSANGGSRCGGKSEHKDLRRVGCPGGSGRVESRGDERGAQRRGRGHWQPVRLGVGTAVQGRRLPTTNFFGGGQ